MNDSPTIVIDQNEVSVYRSLGSPSRPCLVLYSGPDAGQRYDLDTGPQIIDRLPEAQVRIDASGISRQHAELLVGAATVILKDLGSANGTMVNEVRIDDPVTLKDGDLIRVSNVVLRFHAQNSLDLLLHDRIYRMATIDAGTGAFNKKFLADVMRQEFARSRAAGRPLSVIAYDLDHFKAVNDTYGHAAGDLVLRVVTDVARAELRDSDALARSGGEEFTILLQDTPVAGAVEVAERIRASVAAFPIELKDPDAKLSTRSVEHRQTISLGVAGLEPEMLTELELLQAADRALYAAKRNGRNQVSV